MRATISILGLNSYDEAIWDKFQVPTQANKEDIIDEIMLECSDFELLYPDWDVMRHAIGLWSRKELPIWQRLYDAKEFEYNPLWNVDAEIKEVRDVTDNSNYTDNTVGSNSRTDFRDGNTTDNLDEDSTLSKINATNGTTSTVGSEVTDETINRDKDIDSTNTSRKTGTESTDGTISTDTSNLHRSNTFNSGQMIDNNEDIGNSDSTSSSTTTFNTTVNETGHVDETETTDRDQTVNTTVNGTSSENSNGSDTLDRTQSNIGTSHEEGQEQGNYNEDKTGTQARATHDDYHVIRQGNIGVTSSQQLLTEEWEVSQLDPEQYIIDSFKQRFCLLLY